MAIRVMIELYLQQFAFSFWFLSQGSVTIITMSHTPIYAIITLWLPNAILFALKILPSYDKSQFMICSDSLAYFLAIVQQMLKHLFLKIPKLITENTL